MDGWFSSAANIAQLLGINNIKGIFAVLTITLLLGAAEAFYSWMGWKALPITAGYRVMILVVLLVVSAGLWAWFITRPENLIRNSNLSEGTKFWGTGYLETLVTNGRFPADFTKQYPLVLNGGADAILQRSTTLYPPKGYASFLVEHRSGRANDVWSSVSQIVTGLKPHQDYIARFQIRSDHIEPQALFLTLDTRWAKPHRYADAGSYGWRTIELPPFNTGAKDFVEYRFVFQDKARVWLTNFELYERHKP